MTDALTTGAKRLSDALWLMDKGLATDPGIIALVEGMKTIANTSSSVHVRDLAVAALRTWEQG